jgi:hypothetical protein
MDVSDGEENKNGTNDEGGCSVTQAQDKTKIKDKQANRL